MPVYTNPNPNDYNPATVEYEIGEPSRWEYYGSGIDSQVVSITPDPVYVAPFNTVYSAFRCTFCHREFQVDVEAYVNSRYQSRIHQVVRADAIACHPACHVCRTINCLIDHVYCDMCGEYDCEMSEAEHVYCDTCDTYNCGRSHAIHDYSFKPSPRWLGGIPDVTPYYLGFELEVTSYNENEDALRIKEWADANIGRDSLYMKHDGSVEGFEIVSHPMTPQFFESIDWRGFMAQVRANDSGESTYEPHGHGLHVHVSRTAFPNNLTLARWLYMWNCQRNRREAISLCRRESSEWAGFKPEDVKQLAMLNKQGRITENRMLCPCGCGEPLRTANRFYPNFQRYSLINLTNRETVEFRGFRSTRRADHFKKSIRSIYRSVDYVRSMQPWHATSIVEDYSLAKALS